jgi:hypothetical protein
VSPSATGLQPVSATTSTAIKSGERLGAGRLEALWGAARRPSRSFKRPSSQPGWPSGPSGEGRPDGSIPSQGGDDGGEPADPPTLLAAVPDWKPGRRGTRFHLGHNTFVVVGERDDDVDLPPVMIVDESVWAVFPDR